jgi:hypothetical protein
MIIGYESCSPPTAADPTELARTMLKSEDPQRPRTPLLVSVCILIVLLWSR